MNDVSRILLFILLLCYVTYLNVEMAGTHRDDFDLEEDLSDGDEEDEDSSS